MRNYHLSRPPRSFVRSTVYLDNVALLPASLLPFKARWQAIANDLPQGETLVVLPASQKVQRIARSVASQLRAKGKYVRLLDKKLMWCAT